MFALAKSRKVFAELFAKSAPRRRGKNGWGVKQYGLRSKFVLFKHKSIVLSESLAIPLFICAFCVKEKRSSELCLTKSL